MQHNEVKMVVKAINDAARSRTSAANNASIYWVDFHRERCVRLMGASEEFVDPSDAESLPEPAGFLEGGGHIALENCELVEFWRMQPAFPS